MTRTRTWTTLYVRASEGCIVRVYVRLLVRVNARLYVFYMFVGWLVGEGWLVDCDCT